MKKTLLLVFILATSLTVEAAKTNYAKLIPANSKEITFTGRTKTVDDGAVKFDWTGVYAQTKFSGTSVAMRLSVDGTCGFNVFIDGKFVQKILDKEKEAHNITLAEGLSNHQHELRLQKCTEGGQGMACIFGFFFDKGAKLEAVTPQKRYIEVFGDSYTCGYGTESLSHNEHFKVETENSDKGYACIIARYFNADYSIAAHSGLGMVRNYADKESQSKKTMSTRQWYTLDEHGEELYTDSTRHPDIVIINLGTNDFSRNNSPKENQFVNAYVKFIKNIRTRYGQVPIICVVPHTACQYLRTCMTMLKELTQELNGIEIVSFTDNIVTVEYDTGADGHPNYSGHRKIAMTLIPVVSKLTGWQLEDNVVK